MKRKLYTQISNLTLKAAMLCAALLLTGTVTLSAQTTQVSGIVSDKGGGIPGVTITVVGNNYYGTVSAADGSYSIRIPASDDVRLRFSFIGYKTQTVSVGGRSNLNVVLEEDATGIDEVIVMGYGSVKKEFVAGAVSQVSGAELVRTPMANVSQLMVGKLSGITTVQRSGLPGDDNVGIAVRGYNTFNDASPLVIVDGVERPINYVNIYDIESVTILKDAGAAAVYGVKGASGVILITTKQGRTGEATFSYNASTSFTTNTAFPEFLNGEDFLYWYNYASELDGKGKKFGADIISKVVNGDPDGLFANTNWYDQIFKNFGFTQRHNISATGGTDKLKYYSSLGIHDQDGIIKNVNYRRYNLRANMEARIAKNLNFYFSTSGHHLKREYPVTGLENLIYMGPVEQVVHAAPILSPMYNGMWTGWSQTPGAETYNPLAVIQKEAGYKKTYSWNTQNIMKLEYSFNSVPALQGLKVVAQANYDFGFTSNQNYEKGYDMYALDAQTMEFNVINSTGISKKGNYSKSASYGTTILFRPYLEYQRTFKERHNVRGMMIYEQKQTYDNTMTGNKEGYDFSQGADITLGESYSESGTIVSGSHSRTAHKAYIGWFTYTLDQKYILDFSFRADGTYLFDKSNRWGFFPAITAGWIMSGESWFKAAFPKIDFFKLRASFGELGNNDVSGVYGSYFRTTTNNYVFGGTANSAYYTSWDSPISLTWSRTRKSNVGFDITAWRGLFGLEIDAFYEYSYDLLESAGSYPPSLGGYYPDQNNSGRLANRGIDFTMKHYNQVTHDFAYNIKGIFTWSRNKLLSRVEGEGILSRLSGLGSRIGSMYGYRVLGMYQTQEDLDKALASPSSYGAIKLGAFIYDDVNGDGVIDSKDWVQIGNPTMPEMNFAMEFNFYWRNFQLNALFKGSAITSYTLSGTYTGNYSSGVIDNTAYTEAFYVGGNSPYYLVENSWTPTNTNAKYPTLSTDANPHNAYNNSVWVQNGNYLRLRELSLMYSFPEKWLQNTGIKGLDISAGATNLWTWHSFKYVDPEMPSVSNGYYPQQKEFTLSLNITF
ncbi:MAG: TonB-dependent receptor [Alistipes sp.]|nr:TonB-dependent receptor [Alistipes sp.]